MCEVYSADVRIKIDEDKVKTGELHLRLPHHFLTFSAEYLNDFAGPALARPFKV